LTKKIGGIYEANESNSENDPASEAEHDTGVKWDK